MLRPSDHYHRVERDQYHPLEEDLYTFTFPVFIFTYVPISIVALFRKVEWSPITHNVCKSIEEVQQ